MNRQVVAAAIVLVTLIPSGAQAATLRPTDQDGLNLRAGPGTTHQVIGSLAAGKSLKVLGEQDGWYKVSTASGQEAWAAGWVSIINFDDEQAEAVVNTDVLNVRLTPHLTGKVLTQIKQNERVRLREIAGDWWHIRTATGVEGWVSAQYMKRVAPQPAQPSQPTTPTETAPPTPAPAEPPKPTVGPPPPAPASALPVLPLLPAPTAQPVGNKRAEAAAASSVYTGRDTKAFEVVGSIKAGESLTYLGAAEGWVRVETPRKERGWVPGAAVRLVEGSIGLELTGGRWTLASLSQVAASAPAPAASTPAQPAAPAPVQGGPSGQSYLELRVVRDADGSNMRNQPSTLSDVVRVLPQGDVLEVLEVKIPWIRVNAYSGGTGWVHTGFTDPYTGPVKPAPAPAPAPTPAPTPAPAPAQPQLAADGKFRASLRETAPGTLQLDLEAPGQTLGVPVVVGNTLVVQVPELQQTAILPVGYKGATSLEVRPSALVLVMEQMPVWSIVEQAPGKLSVILRPAVSTVSINQLEDRTVYTFRVTGLATPRTRASGSDVVVEFPGSTGMVTPLPPGLRMTPTATGVEYAVPAGTRPYALKRVDGGFELQLYRPGLAGKTILLDPGHGGIDSGAFNQGTGIREKEINLAMALRLRAMLEAQGAKVLMTRIEDRRVAPPEVFQQRPGEDPGQLDLGHRTRMANELKVDLFLSIHLNCCTGSGTETYYTAGTLNGERSLTLARLMQQHLAPGLGQIDRGAKNDLMFVTRNTDAPGALVEVAFMSHAIEGKLVGQPDYQEKAATLMLKAMEQFFAERPVPIK